MGERSASFSRNGPTTNLNTIRPRGIGVAAMSLAWPLMLASLTAPKLQASVASTG
jgi:hypothetical protein